MPLDCRAPHRCSHCYLEPICDELEVVRATVAESSFEVLRFDSEWDAAQGPLFGGDPASAERSNTRRRMVEMLKKAEAEGDVLSVEAAAVALGKDPEQIQHRKLRLPLFGVAGGGGGFDKPKYPPFATQIKQAEAARGHGVPLWLVSPSLEAAAASPLESFAPSREIELELEDYSGFAAAFEAGQGEIFGRRVRRVVVATVADAEAMLAMDADFEVCVDLSNTVEAWLLEIAEQDGAPARLTLRQPSHERLTTSAERDIDLPAFFSRFTHLVPVEDVPSCVIGRPARPKREVLDASMMTLDGKLEIFRYIKRYILDRYRRKSLRCKTCIYTQSCEGMHISYIRAHGFALMNPVEDPASGPLTT